MARWKQTDPSCGAQLAVRIEARAFKGRRDFPQHAVLSRNRRKTESGWQPVVSALPRHGHRAKIERVREVRTGDMIELRAIGSASICSMVKIVGTVGTASADTPDNCRTTSLRRRLSS